MIGIVYSFNNERKIIVLNYKVLVGVYLFDEFRGNIQRYYSLEKYSDIKTERLYGDYLFNKTHNSNPEEMIVEGLIKIYLSKTI